jgi:hypothetical protein
MPVAVTVTVGMAYVPTAVGGTEMKEKRALRA